LGGKIGNQRRTILHDVDFARHQEVHDDIDGRSAIVCGNGTHELEAPEPCALFIATLHQGFDKRRVFTVAQRFRIEAYINIHRTNVRHLLIVEQQPWHGTADNGKFPPEAAEHLPDFDQDAFDRGRRAVVVVSCRLRLSWWS
jgi:hypothetical protein